MTVNWTPFTEELPPVGQRIMLTGKIEEYAPPDGDLRSGATPGYNTEVVRVTRRWLAHGSRQPAPESSLWRHQYVAIDGQLLPMPDYWSRVQSPDTLGWAK